MTYFYTPVSLLASNKSRIVTAFYTYDAAQRAFSSGVTGGSGKAVVASAVLGAGVGYLAEKIIDIAASTVFGKGLGGTIASGLGSGNAGVIADFFAYLMAKLDTPCKQKSFQQ